MAHSGPKRPHPDTLAVHAGQSPDPATGSRAVPIYQTASYVFPDTDTAAALFNMETPGHVYSRLYGGSHNLLQYTLPRFGIEATFVPVSDMDAWNRAIRPETRLLFGESVGNPAVDVLDIPSVSALA